VRVVAFTRVSAADRLEAAVDVVDIASVFIGFGCDSASPKSSILPRRGRNYASTA
jgi:hypothetical protein